MDLQNIIFLSSRRSSAKSRKSTNAFHSTLYLGRRYPLDVAFQRGHQQDGTCIHPCLGRAENYPQWKPEVPQLPALQSAGSTW